jgi:hypothetical protein
MAYSPAKPAPTTTASAVRLSGNDELGVLPCNGRLWCWCRGDLWVGSSGNSIVSWTYLGHAQAYCTPICINLQLIKIEPSKWESLSVETPGRGPASIIRGHGLAVFVNAEPHRFPVFVTKVHDQLNRCRAEGLQGRLVIKITTKKNIK